MYSEHMRLMDINAELMNALQMYHGLMTELPTYASYSAGAGYAPPVASYAAAGGPGPALGLPAGLPGAAYANISQVNNLCIMLFVCCLTGHIIII